ncbi:Adenine-specific methyltransferase EcoRI [Cryobacterium flavum]|uniref:Adenine-specific methyltransferase EcoRI n=1 Tax=Cryobacterium flavum TaxID=1424659 RepID=A0A4R8V497_9MICO|nr:adenine-specific methyltransferase EcoRI family protein [Cryobacterium flavum]TFB76747.1 DNA methyltransferase [Cryobacterium flavum]SDO07983.1 Adenine-specific methyltransferase EcoRI [Cryobacterium flavum]
MSIVENKTSNLNAAKAVKNDEFYTQWADIEREMNAYRQYDVDVFRNKVVLLPCDDPEWSNFAKFFALHFVDFGLKKLISTSYAPESNPAGDLYQPTLFETENPKYDETKTRLNGKKFVLERNDINGDGVVNIDDLQWEYLEGSGDFRSLEVTALRDEADIVITNPPFSLFRDFVGWLMEGGKKFSVIGNNNATTYVEIFPPIKENKLWKGATANATDMVFGVPKGATIKEADRLKAERLGYPPNDDHDFTRLGNACWFTNIDHGRRHEPLQLLTIEDHIKYSKHKEIRGVGYQRYYNFPDAIEVSYVDAIPSDFDGIMGVPITFLDKYNPDQFEIVASAEDMAAMRDLGVSMLGPDFVQAYFAGGGTGGISVGHRKLGLTKPRYYTTYKRILIRRKDAK